MQTITRVLGTTLVAILFLASCAGGGSGLTGNTNGSEPLNESETRQYKAQLLKCYKTGGSRVVKIEGQLRCY